MRCLLRCAALYIAITVVAIWLLRGHNRGWTKNTVTHFVRDPVTELDKPVEEKKYVPGVDFLAEGFVVAGVLGASSFFFRKKK